MAFKKILGTYREEKGQATLEYFVLFGLIIVLSIFLSTNTFLKQVKDAMQQGSGFQRVANKIIEE